MQPGAKLRGAYLGVIILQPHASTQRFRFRILRRTRSFPGRTSARSLSDRIESIWETLSKERAWPALQRSVLCRGECSAKKRALQRTVLCKEARSAEESAQRRALCKGERSAEKRALQRSVLCRGECSAKETDSFISLVVCLHKQKIFNFAPEAGSPKVIL